MVSRRDSLKMLAAFPLIGFVLFSSKKKPAVCDTNFQQLFKCIDFDTIPTVDVNGFDNEVRRAFNSSDYINCCGRVHGLHSVDNGTIRGTINTFVLKKGSFFPDCEYECLINTDYAITNNNLGLGLEKQIEGDYVTVPMPEFTVTSKDYAELVAAALVDKNVVVFDADANGYSVRLNSLMSEFLYTNGSGANPNYKGPKINVIHFDDYMMKYATETLGMHLSSGKTRLCVGIKNSDLPFYHIKYKGSHGLVVLRSDNIVLGMY